eukprot:3034017-Alexandrium_andersonii.AAC.1
MGWSRAVAGAFLREYPWGGPGVFWDAPCALERTRGARIVLLWCSWGAPGVLLGCTTAPLP